MLAICLDRQPDDRIAALAECRPVLDRHHDHARRVDLYRRLDGVAELAAADRIEPLGHDRLAQVMDAVGQKVELLELVLVLHDVGNGDEASALGAAIGRLRAREEPAQIEMRIVLVEDVLAALSHPQDASGWLVPDFPELGALTSVGATDLLAVLVDLVLGLLVGVAGVRLEPLARLVARQVARRRHPRHLVPAARRPNEESPADA